MDISMNGFFSFIFLFLAVIIIPFLIIMIVFYILSSIGLWKMFQKANKPGWIGFIPIYNTYVLCQITGVNPWWMLIVFLLYFFSFLPFVGIVAFLANLYFVIILAVSTARSYGKDTGYAFGLFFLFPIFFMILGCGESKYLGPKPMDDFVFSQFSSSNMSSSDVNTGIRYCSNCGASLDSNMKYCPKCGKEL